MRKSNTLDPAEVWLANQWIGDRIIELPPSDLIREIKSRIADHLQDLFKSHNHNSPPYEPEILFKNRRVVHKVEARMSSGHSGALIPTKDGFIMKISATEPLNRKRFSVAHELGHTFFYDLSQNIPRKMFSDSRYWVEEDYANAIAGMILLPEEPLKNLIDTNQLWPSFDALTKLTKLFRVSSEVLFRRIVRELQLWDCLVFSSTIYADQSIRTNSHFVFKGMTFKFWTVPRVIPAVVNNTNHQSRGTRNSHIWKEHLASHIISTFKARATNSIHYFTHKDVEYTIQSKIYGREAVPQCLTLVRTKELE